MGRSLTVAGLVVALSALAAPGARGQRVAGSRFETPRVEWTAAPGLRAAPELEDPTTLTSPVQGGGHGLGSALGIEWAGGLAGSLAGLGLGTLIIDPDDCSNEDLECILTGTAGVVLVGAVGSAAGAWAAGRWQDTDPSLPGAILGGMAGIVAGLALDHLLAEDIDLVRHEGVRIVIYSATQGLVAALGSRLGDALR